MNFVQLVKKQTVGNWLTLASFLLSLVAFIIYMMNGANPGYFQGTTTALVISVSLFAIILSLATLVVSQFHIEGTIGRVVALATDALQIVVPVLLAVAFFAFVGDRIEGLAYIFGADANTLSEIQTPNNMSSAFTAITGFVFYFLAFVIALVASFFRTPEDVAVKNAEKAKA